MVRFNKVRREGVSSNSGNFRVWHPPLMDVHLDPAFIY